MKWNSVMIYVVSRVYNPTDTAPIQAFRNKRRAEKFIEAMHHTERMAPVKYGYIISEISLLEQHYI